MIANHRHHITSSRRRRHHQDIAPQYPDDNLQHVASARLLREVRFQNRGYFQAAVLACTMAAFNFGVSAVYLSLNFGGLATGKNVFATTRAFNINHHGLVVLLAPVLH